MRRLKPRRWSVLGFLKWCTDFFRTHNGFVMRRAVLARPRDTV
jgi:hypothetical protein